MLNSILGRTEKADYSTPGFKWKQMKKKQGIKGRIYSAWPMRAKTRLWPAMGIGFFWGLLATGGTNLAAIFIWMLCLYAIALIWPTWPCGSAIKITPQRLSIGGKGYDVNEITMFSAEQKSLSKNIPNFIITFEYGRKTIKIKNANRQKDAYRIAEALDQLVKEAKKVQLENNQEQIITQQYGEPEQVRAAAF